MRTRRGCWFCGLPLPCGWFAVAAAGVSAARRAGAVRNSRRSERLSRLLATATAGGDSAGRSACSAAGIVLSRSAARRGASRRARLPLCERFERGFALLLRKAALHSGGLWPTRSNASRLRPRRAGARGRRRGAAMRGRRRAGAAIRGCRMRARRPVGRRDVARGGRAIGRAGRRRARHACRRWPGRRAPRRRSPARAAAADALQRMPADHDRNGENTCCQTKHDNGTSILNSHVAAKEMREPWIGSLAARIVAPICVEFTGGRVHRPFIGSAARADRQGQDDAGPGRRRRCGGLAVARAAARKGHEVIVAEATKGIGNGVSSRNSEVIHGGMYYPTGSLRAYHCPRGRRLMYEFCASHGVPHRKCGKLIVATEDGEVAKMEAILKQGEANGVEGLQADRRRRGARHGAGAELRRGAAFAGDRHRRQPFVHARAAGRSGGPRRRDRLQHQGRAAAPHPGRLGGAVFRQRERRARGRRGGEFGRPRRAGVGAPHRGLSAGARAAARARARQLLRLRRTAGVLAADLSGAAHRRRPRHPRDARSRRPHALRSRRRVDRGGELQRQSGAGEVVLRQHPALLAGPARQFIAAGLCRRPAEADRAGRARRGLHDRRTGAARIAGPDPSVRDRIAGTDLVAVAGRRGGGSAWAS